MSRDVTLVAYVSVFVLHYYVGTINAFEENIVKFYIASIKHRTHTGYSKNAKERYFYLNFFKFCNRFCVSPATYWPKTVLRWTETPPKRVIVPKVPCYCVCVPKSDGDYVRFVCFFSLFYFSNEKICSTAMRQTCVFFSVYDKYRPVKVLRYLHTSRRFRSRILRFEHLLYSKRLTIKSIEYLIEFFSVAQRQRQRLRFFSKKFSGL